MEKQDYITITNYSGMYSIYRKIITDLPKEKQEKLKHDLERTLNEKGYNLEYYVTLNKSIWSAVGRTNHKIKEFHDESDKEVFLISQKILN